MTIEDWRVAIVVDPALPVGFLTNTVATISIGLGAACPKLAGDILVDATQIKYSTSANRPVPILQAAPALIQELFQRCSTSFPRTFVVPFPTFARRIHSYADYIAEVARRDIKAEQMDGIGFVGASSSVRSLTGALKLLR
jgi:Protein of unknown function (DUF2000)